MMFFKTRASDQSEREGFRVSAKLVELTLALQDRNIAACCFKGRGRLARALSGESDLDLLMSHGDKWKAMNVLAEHGFKYFPDIPGRDHPAVMSFLGHDETSGKIAHVHVHFRLVLGNSMLKNHRLPCEDGFLARRVQHPVLPIDILDAVDEALLLAARTHLELRRIDPVLAMRWPASRRKYAADFKNLAAIVSEEALSQRAAELFSAELARDLARDFFRVDQPRSRWRLRSRIARELRTHRLYCGPEAFPRACLRTLVHAAGRINKSIFHWPRPSGRKALGGGVVVALVGVDGSGKSTALARARAWLQGEIDVHSIYFGTGDGRPSLAMLPFKLAATLVSPLIKSKPRGASHGTITDKPPGFAYSIAFAIWASAVAFEKRQKLVAARRAASRGMIVITDRYPQNEIPRFNDGPLLHRLPRAPAWLRRYEENAYALARRTPPDLVIKLHAGREAVMAREPDMAAELVDQRIQWLRELTFPGARVVSIDATQSLDEVTRIVKREIWNSI